MRDSIPESLFVEAMARAMCLAAGDDPDAPPSPLVTQADITMRWHCYRGRALEQYRAHSAMMKIIFDELMLK